jgi:hypothetical protein
MTLVQEPLSAFRRLPDPRCVLAIDPGSQFSGWLVYQPATASVRAFGKVPNDELLAALRTGDWVDWPAVDVVVIEAIEPRYGLQMGWETLDTSRWTGRFQEAAHPRPVVLLRRSEILRHLEVVTSPRKGEKRVSADSGVRQALTDRFGGKEAAIGRKATPGPLHGITADVWAALAVAVVFDDLHPQGGTR